MSMEHLHRVLAAADEKIATITDQRDDAHSTIARLGTVLNERDAALSASHAKCRELDLGRSNLLRAIVDALGCVRVRDGDDIEYADALRALAPTLAALRRIEGTARAWQVDIPQEQVW